MISNEFEKTLKKAQDNAKTHNHQFMTLEHLLLAMIDDKDVIKVLKVCRINIEVLKLDVENFVKNKLKDLILKDGDEDEAKPTLGFQRVIQRGSYTCSIFR